MTTQHAFANCVSALLTIALCSTSTAATERSEQSKKDDVYPVYDSDWVPYIALGAQFLPDYDEEGRSSGLAQQQFFGSITVDGRFGEERAFDWRRPFASTFHTGITLSLLGSPVKREDKPAVSPDEFNDIARTLVSSAYVFSPAFHQSRTSGHNVGPTVRIGAISRESLGNRGDSVNWFYSAGLQYSSEKFMNPLYTAGTKEPRNGVPEGYLRLSAARFEDYAALGRKTRLVGDAALRIYPELNLFLGVQGNFGSGPDEFMLVLSMARQPSEIANLFTLGKAD